MFGNNFFPQFFVFKNSFMFSRTKNLFGYSKKSRKQKNISTSQIMKEIENSQMVVSNFFF